MGTRADRWDRRKFLRRVAVIGTAGLVRLRPERTFAEPPPETTKIRLFKFPGICLAPQYIAEDLLRMEGFTDVEYVEFKEAPANVYDRVASGLVDLTQWYGAPFIVEIDKGAPVVFLAGVHVGCNELFGGERVRAIRDLKGKTIAVPGTSYGGPQYTILVALLSYIGLDYRKDVQFVERPASESVQLLADGKIDAFLALPPLPQELRTKKIGHVVVSMATDRPWSQYFCCLVVAHKDFVRKYPVAAKRAVRAILKADQICALEPERVARSIVDRGFTKSYEYALQTMRDIPYGRWRQYDPEDAVRFYALRLHEAGVIKSNPKKIIAEGTDWRILNELKKELKA